MHVRRYVVFAHFRHHGFIYCSDPGVSIGKRSCQGHQLLHAKGSTVRFHNSQLITWVRESNEKCFLSFFLFLFLLPTILYRSSTGVAAEELLEVIRNIRQ